MKAWILILLCVSLLSAGCSSYNEPATAEVYSLLTPTQARQVGVWSTNHDAIWTLRIHSLDSCPFFYARIG